MTAPKPPEAAPPAGTSAPAFPLRIVLPGRPYTKKNSPTITTRGRPRLIPSKPFLRWQEKCGDALCGIVEEPFDFGVGLEMLVVLPHRGSCGDQVGYIQAACDLLEHYGVVSNDKWITVLERNGDWLEFDRDAPRMEIVLWRHRHPLEKAKEGGSLKKPL